MSDYTAKYTGRVNRYLLSRIKGRPEVLYKAASHLIENGGKRLRPYMVIKSCQVLGGAPGKAMPAAGAIEMVHNFTLIHDDIMDNDGVRHGVPTVHKKYDDSIAILAGDILFSKAFETVVQTQIPSKDRGELVSRLARACVEVCEGQVMDIRMAGDRKIPAQSQYITMICKKTAALFDASCAMGAICAGGRPRDIANMSSFGKNLGVAFQITDDLIGVMGDPKITKKPVGNDLREGKKSLPIVMAINRAGGGDRKAIIKCFGNPKAGAGDLKKATSIMSGLGVEEAVRAKAAGYAARAKRSLKGYDGRAGAEMASLLDFVVKRAG